jgi:hypothetical protein
VDWWPSRMATKMNVCLWKPMLAMEVSWWKDPGLRNVFSSLSLSLFWLEKVLGSILPRGFVFNVFHSCCLTFPHSMSHNRWLSSSHCLDALQF